MDLSETFTKPLKDFAKNSLRLVKRCTKPDAKGTLGTNARVKVGGGRPGEVLVVGRSGRRARAGGLGGSFRTPPHPRKIPPARTKRVDDRQGGVWGAGQIAGVLLLPPPHTHPNTTPPASPVRARFGLLRRFL